MGSRFDYFQCLGMGCGNWGISVLGNESLGKKGVFGVLDEVYGLGQLFC